MLKICILGGGNLGTLLAAEFAHQGFEVVIHTSAPSNWDKEISVFSSDDEFLFKATNFVVTNSLRDAVHNADQIWITLPAFLFPQLAESLLPLVHSGQTIFCVPGSGGAEFSFFPLIQKGCTFCGLQRVHSIARLKEYGRSVYMLGRKSCLQLASIPRSETKKQCAIVSEMLKLPCEALDNYLIVTLTPSNPILHTSRLYSMFKDYRPEIAYDHNFLFYEEWSDDASIVLFQCDDELQNLCRVLNGLNLEKVVSLKEYYESYTPEAMTAKMRSIKAFKGLTSPMKQTRGGWIPDFSSRYFTADFAYGLKVILDISAAEGTNMPALAMLWNWYLQTSPLSSKHFVLQDPHSFNSYCLYTC